jgi:hypothetical protein
MVTAITIVKTAMQELGALGLNEAPSDDEAQSAFEALNDLINQNNSETTVIYSVANTTYSFVSGQADYTFGVGGSTSTSRFDILFKAFIKDSNGVEYPLEIINYDKYSDISIKSLNSTFPFAVYDDSGYPVRTLTMYPVPSDSSYSLVLWYGKVIPALTDLTDILDAPSEYDRYYKTNLAIELASRLGREPSPSLVARANDSKLIIERSNYKPLEMSMPNMGGNRGGVRLGEYLGAMF